MHKGWLLIAGILIFLGSAIRAYSTGISPNGMRFARVQIGDQSFQVEVADTLVHIEKGLMHRKSLSAGQGMLFVFPKEAYYPFWMKNTLIPLDVVWIDNALRVVGVQTMHTCSKQQEASSSCPEYVSKHPVRYVLEVNAGECESCRGKVLIERWKTAR